MPKIRIDGETFLVVRSSALRRPRTYSEAAAMVRRLVRSDRDLAVLRESLEARHVDCFHMSPADILGRAAEELAQGHLVFVLEEAAARPLDAPSVRDLIDPSDRPSVQERPTTPGRGPDQAPTFIEVVLVDDQGSGVEADYVLSIDGTPQPGTFADATPVRIDPIGADAVATVQLEHIGVPMRPAVFSNDDPADAPGVEARTSVTFVGEDGAPIQGAVATLLVDGEPERELNADGSKNELGVLPSGPHYAVRVSGLGAS